MPKFESAPNLNNPELNPSEVGVDINAGKKLEGELTSEEKVEGGQGQEAEKPKLLPEEQFKNLEKEIKIKQEEIARLSESIEGTKSMLNVAREKLGLSPTEEDPPSVFSEKDKLEKLQIEQEALEKQVDTFIQNMKQEDYIKWEVYCGRCGKKGHKSEECPNLK